MRPVGAASPSHFRDEHRPWLEMLDAIGASPHGLRLPDRAELSSIFPRLAIDQADAAEIIEGWPSPTKDPEIWWLLERAYHALVSDLGGIEPLRWPNLPPEFGATGRFFYVYLFLAALGDVRAWHERRGIPDDVSWTTLADLGRNLTRDRRLLGDSGLRTSAWLTLHFRGVIYALGRLQFNLSRFQEGPALGIHIPESGPLSPEACDASFRWAQEFFPAHFPETPWRVGMCYSWLLDDQLAEYLDERSNIIRFQRRFRIVGEGSNGDAEILRFVFKRIAPDIDELPQRTKLERAIVAHLRAGRHWRNRTGWLPL
ncbi:MAG: hypothetical protein E6J09_10870 [Chloroflexi bacterium]|nr:MAG: hypothetical protein E6J09_10870 [Chloroflexota bacterium]